MSSLGPNHLDDWPVWSEYYDFEELEEIEHWWGITPDAVLGMHEAMNLGSEHSAYPLPVYDPLPGRMRVYIKAVFTTHTGGSLPGFVVNDDAYAGVVYLEATAFHFNVMLPESLQALVDGLAAFLEIDPQDVEPIRCRSHDLI